MIRTTILFLYVLGLSGYAWRNWFVSLCGLIAMIAVNEHPDMPKTLFGLPGLNPWNLLLANVIGGWLVNRRREKLRFDLPFHVAVLALAYLVVILVAFGRMVENPTIYLDHMEPSYLWMEYLVNSLKWAIPGWLLFDGARTPERQRMAILSILAVYFIFGLQVMKRVPPSMAVNMDVKELEHVSLRLIQKGIGYSRVNMSMILAGGSWAILAAGWLLKTVWWRRLVPVAFLMTAYAQALTAGRMGYVTWGCIGLIFGLFRRRRYLLYAPFIVAGVLSLVPAARDRLLTGVSSESAEESNTYEMTSGRTLIWPVVIDKAHEAPLVGFGMLAMQRTGLSYEYRAEDFPHPHNAYLELLLDSGYVGLIAVVLFYLVVLVRSGRLFLRPRDGLELAAGGASLALTLALLIAAMGSQHFYPQTGSVGMWCAIGLTNRLVADRDRLRRTKRRPAYGAQPVPKQRAAMGRA